MKFEQLITAIRESFIGSKQVYTEGSCYRLFKIVHTVFPQARAIHHEAHIYIDYAGSYWDIEGEVNDESLISAIAENGDDITDNPDIAEEWNFSIYDLHIECPNCDELFFRAELEPENISKTKERYEKSILRQTY